jgi:DNA-binding response OmpR family regulator
MMTHGGGIPMTTILILDDDESIRLLYEEELTDEGYDVLSKNDGADTAELVLEKRPDLVVLDIKLGDSSGFDVLKKIRAEDDLMPVIFCTGYTLSLKEARAMGADDVVIKSSDLSALKLKVKKALRSTPKRTASINEVPCTVANSRMDA